MHVYSQGLAVLVIGMGLGEVISRILGFLMVGSESHMFSVSLVALFCLTIALWASVKGEVFADETADEDREAIIHASGRKGSATVEAIAGLGGESSTTVVESILVSEHGLGVRPVAATCGPSGACYAGDGDLCSASERF